MTLNIFSPVGGGPIGPGVVSSVQSIGNDSPAGSHWEFEVLDFLGPPVNIALRHSFPAGLGATPPPGFIIGSTTAGTMTQPSVAVRAVQGDLVDWRVSLYSGSTGLVVDQAQLTGVWDASHQFWLATEPGSAAGFTAADRADLVLVKGAVWKEESSLTPSGLPIISQVIDFLRGPPRALLQPTTCLGLSGRGGLEPLTDGTGASTFGALWDFVTIPPGFGAQLGQQDQYFNRIAQFVIVRHDANGTTYFDEVIDARGEPGYTLWKSPQPDRVLYDIAPGCAVNWCWLR